MRVSSFLKVVPVCALLVGFHAGFGFGWNIDFTLSPWHSDPSCQDEFSVYNNTGERVFIYHDKTGIKYTLEPGQSGELTYKGSKLKFHPNEIRCGFPHGTKQCVVKSAPFGFNPALVLEALNYPHATPAPSPRPETPPLIRRAPAVQPPEREVRKASAPAPARNDSESLPELLRLLLERMVYVYHRERGEAKNRKLSELKEVLDRQLAGSLPPETAARLKDYEALCQCIHERAASGMSLDEIFKEGRCGARSTRELRAAIVSDFAQHIRRHYARPAM